METVETLLLKESSMVKASAHKSFPSVERFVRILRQGANLIENLSDATYTRRDRAKPGSVGSHFRHVVEFVFLFNDGIKVGKVDYNRRGRDIRTEQSRSYAVSQFNLAIDQLENLPANIEHRQILLRLESSGGSGNEERGWCISSVLRELEYLQSHTIHHYALIAEKLSGQGIKVGKDFGVAPSTSDFWAKNPARENFAYRQIVGL